MSDNWNAGKAGGKVGVILTEIKYYIFQAIQIQKVTCHFSGQVIKESYINQSKNSYLCVNK